MVLKTGEFSPNIKTCGCIQKVTTGVPSNVNKKPDKSQNIPKKHAPVEVLLRNRKCVIKVVSKIIYLLSSHKTKFSP